MEWYRFEEDSGVLSHIIVSKSYVDKIDGKIDFTKLEKIISEIEVEGIGNLGLNLKQHNEKFAVKPELTQDLHRSIDGFDLDNIFCIKEERILQNNFCSCINNKMQLLGESVKNFV